MNLFRLFAKISFMTVTSRLFGFIRDSIIAQVYGAGISADAFFIAFKIPNLLRRIFAEGAFSQAFIPILTEYKNQQGKEATRTFIAYIAGTLTIALAIVTMVGVICAPWIIHITAPGIIKNYNKFTLTVDLLRIIFPYIFLISLSALVGAILNTWNRFIVPAFAPTLLNISIILFSIFVSQYFNPPIISLAWSVVLGGFLQFIYQLPYLKKIGMLVLPRFLFMDSGVWRVIKMMWPVIIGVSVSQISLIINTIFASFLQSGSVSWMYYADRLIELPLGILGVTFGTVLLPLLTKSFIDGDQVKYQQLMDWCLRLCLMLTLPCVIGLIILSEALTVSLFQYGNFTAYDSLMTQYAIKAYCIGLTGMVLVKILVPGFYSRQDTHTPVRIAIVTLILTQLMNGVFIVPLRHAGLALSIGLAACFNASLLFWRLYKKKIFQPVKGWKIFFLKLFLALLVMCFVLFTILNFMPLWNEGHMLIRILRLIVVIVAGALSYFITLFVLGFRFYDFFKFNIN
ncbi:Probable peptidoglycan biosynthesis protein MurJ [Candidatus Providencia siddallii]|uniref:Probable lipid II flippase MurJ n=1 Tax=Candidatus Providencia siddallii TaxID=1715285 RepID=A0A0M6W6Z4_9GAMM|nr:Probable peptidoglycan biosynthesis protein MurJ [Candidatus Providencia siddallii]